MKHICLFMMVAVVASMAAVLATTPVLACDMAHGGHASAAPEQTARIEDLRAKLKANSAAIAASQDQAQLLELLKERTELQDALLAEMMPVPGSPAEPRSGTHQH